MENIIINPQQLLEHWQGHRRLTRRMIETFPEDKLFTYSVGGMRPFGELAVEMLSMAAPGVQGIVTGDWSEPVEQVRQIRKDAPRTRETLLQQWDAATAEINTSWSQIPPHRFQEVDKAFGQYEGEIYGTILYLIDNEIHHRGQGYVYLRALGIEPPPFWER